MDTWPGDFVSFFELHDKFWVAFGTLVIALFTIVLGFATIFMWRATRKLVISADRNAERQLRAYVFVNEQRLSNVVVGQRPKAQLLIRNTGLTPAHNVVTWLGITVANYPLAKELREATQEYLKTSSRRIAGPGSAFGTEVAWEEALTAQHLSMLANGTAAVFVWGEITYTDAFGCSRTTRLRSYYGGDTGMRDDGYMTDDVDGNSAD